MISIIYIYTTDPDTKIYLRRGTTTGVDRGGNDHSGSGAPESICLIEAHKRNSENRRKGFS